MATQDLSPLPISRTCQNCAHAKIKCHKSPNATVCDRCHRLKKECVFRQAKRRIYGSRKDNRIEALEAKVNELLDARNPSSATSASPEASCSISQASNLAFRESRPSQFTVPESTSPYHEVNGTRSQSITSGRDIIESGLLSLQDANQLLDVYRNVMTLHFPFVVIPSYVTAEALREEKPFLFLVIMTVTLYDNLPLQRILDLELKKAVSTRIILGGEISFDLLQGLLADLAWGQYHARPRRWTQFLGLAVSMIADLRLDRPPHSASWTTQPGVADAHSIYAQEHSRLAEGPHPNWGRDVQRAVIGCYYLASGVSALLEKIPMLPYTAYMELCCESLRATGEYATDKYLLYITRLQRILAKTSHHTVQHTKDLLNPDSAIQLYVASIEEELSLFRQGLPFSMSEHPMTGMLYYTTELYLYQTCLMEGNDSGERETSWPPWRREMLAATITSAKTLLEFYLSLPIGAEKTYNNTEYIQIGFATTLVAKLSIISLNKGIRESMYAMREALNPASLIQGVIDRLSALVTEQRDATGDRDIFFHNVKRIKRVQTWHQNQLVRIHGKAEPTNTQTFGNHFTLNVAPYDATFSETAQSAEAAANAFAGPIIDDSFILDGINDLQYANFFNADITYDAVMGGWMPDPMGPS